MENIYKTKINGASEFAVTTQDISELDLMYGASSLVHVLKDNRSYQAEIVHSGFFQKKYVVKINGTTYAIEIFDELDLMIEEMGFTSSSSQDVNTVEAPMPGLILDINVKAGQAVTEDDSLLILEAMKMENNISSPRSGIIRAVNVKKGEAVDKKQVLIEFE